MASQAVDIFSMLNKAQNEYNQQNSVAAFFQQASSNNGNHYKNRTMQGPMQPQPVPMKQVSSLEIIEGRVGISPTAYHNLHAGEQSNVANSPLAQFFNSNNMNNLQQKPADSRAQKEKQNNRKVSAPPGFASKAQPQKNLLASKETKLITPVMFAPTITSEKKTAAAEPLTKNQLLQALNYLIQNDEDFMVKVHEAYIKSFKTMST